MTKFSLSIPELHRSVIGFDRLFEQAERRLQNLTSYPPHNIIKIADNEYQIEFAVAGFAKQDLKVELQDGVLVVSGEQKDHASREYVYQGIATRQFKKVLQLGEYMEVVGAELDNGILVVSVEHKLPLTKQPKQVEIS